MYDSSRFRIALLARALPLSRHLYCRYSLPSAFALLSRPASAQLLPIVCVESYAFVLWAPRCALHRGIRARMTFLLMQLSGHASPLEKCKTHHDQISQIRNYFPGSPRPLPILICTMSHVWLDNVKCRKCPDLWANELSLTTRHSL